MIILCPNDHKCPGTKLLGKVPACVPLVGNTELKKQFYCIHCGCEIEIMLSAFPVHLASRYGHS